MPYPNSTTISYERIFLLIPPPPPTTSPFSLAIHVPKEKSKEMALESIPSASLGFADSPYDVAISCQSPPCVFVPLSRPSFLSVPPQTHFLIHSRPHNIYICNCFPKLHCPQSYPQCKFEVTPFALFSFLGDRREEVVT